MPEGHTIHRLARDLGELRGRTVRAESPQGRFVEGAARLDNVRVLDSDAYGKHLFVLMATGESVHVHLGMQGKWLRYPDPSPPARPQVRLRIATDDVAWDLIAPSTCELVDGPAVSTIVGKLGPDPLRADADAGKALAALRGDPRAIGVALLDQSVLAGVGNVFRNEALHAVGIHPRRPARTLADRQLLDLWTALRGMMHQAVEDGRIVTVDAPDRLAVPEAEARRVYKQTVCHDCGAQVAMAQVGGRTAYLCPVEQPEPGAHGAA